MTIRDVTFNNIGSIYDKEKNYDKALEYYQKSLILREKMGNKAGMVNSMRNIASIMVKNKKFNDALVFAKNGMKMAKELGFPAIIQEMAEEMKIQVSVGELIMVGEVHALEQQKQTFHFIFDGKITEGTPILNPKETSAIAVKWLNINELSSKNLYPNISEKLTQYLAKNLNNKYIGKIEQKWF